MDINVGEAAPADFADVFDEWIAGASINKRSVTIYGKPGLAAEYEQLERDLEVAEEAEKHGAELAGSEVRRITARMEELYGEWQASKSTWTVRGVSSEMAERLKAAEPARVEPEPLVEPKAPVLPERATEQQRKSHTIAMQEYDAKLAAYREALPEHTQAVEAFNDALNLRYITAAVLKIEFADGRTVEAEVDDDGAVVVPAVTVAQLTKLRKRLGETQLLSLITASQAALLVEPEIPAPFSRRTSETEGT